MKRLTLGILQAGLLAACGGSSGNTGAGASAPPVADGVHATIDAAGKVTFALNTGSAAGPKFSGNFDTPLSISGVWTDAAGASGTWVFNHL